MDPSMPDDRGSERANELYWSSDTSVNQIADQLDLSKGSLYALIRPLPSDLYCPRCSTELAYPNRTARERAFVSCPACDYEADEAVARDAGADRPRDAVAVGQDFGAPGGGSVAGMIDSARQGGSLNRVMLGTVLLGVAGGIAFALWARRR